MFFCSIFILFYKRLFLFFEILRYFCKTTHKHFFLTKLKFLQA